MSKTYSKQISKAEQLIKQHPEQRDATIRKLLKRYCAPWYVRLFTGGLFNRYVRQVRAKLRKFTDTRELVTNIEMLDPRTKDPLNTIVRFAKDAIAPKLNFVALDIPVLKFEKSKLPSFLPELISQSTANRALNFNLSDYTQPDTQHSGNSQSALSTLSPRESSTQSPSNSATSSPRGNSGITNDQQQTKLEQAQIRKKQERMRFSAEGKKEQQALLRQKEYLSQRQKQIETAQANRQLDKQKLIEDLNHRQLLIDARIGVQKVRHAFFEMTQLIEKISTIEPDFAEQIQEENDKLSRFTYAWASGLPTTESAHLQLCIDMSQSAQQLLEQTQKGFNQFDSTTRLAVDMLLDKIATLSTQLIQHLNNPQLFNHTQKQAKLLIAQCKKCASIASKTTVNPNNSITDLIQKKNHLSTILLQITNDVSPTLLKHNEVTTSLYEKMTDPKSNPSLIACLFKQPLNSNKIFKQLNDYSIQAKCPFDNIYELLDGSIFLPPDTTTSWLQTDVNKKHNSSFLWKVLKYGFFSPDYKADYNSHTLSSNKSRPAAPNAPGKKALQEIMLEALVDRVNLTFNVNNNEISGDEIVKVLQQQKTKNTPVSTLDELVALLREQRQENSALHSSNPTSPSLN